jgi:hypothetical protein
VDIEPRAQGFQRRVEVLVRGQRTRQRDRRVEPGHV